MRNKAILLGVMLFASGVGVGAVGMRIVTRKQIEKEIEDIFAKEDAARKELRARDHHNLYRPHTSNVDELAGEDFDGDTNDRPESVQKVYKKIAKSYSTYDAIEDDIEGEIESRQRARKQRNPIPYIITMDEYENEEENDKVELVYYVEDNVMVDENEETIGNYEEIVGDYVRVIEPSEEDDDWLCIRNDHLEIDYLIEINPSSYECEVMGICAEEGEE